MKGTEAIDQKIEFNYTGGTQPGDPPKRNDRKKTSARTIPMGDVEKERTATSGWLAGIEGRLRTFANEIGH